MKIHLLGLFRSTGSGEETEGVEKNAWTKMETRQKARKKENACDKRKSAKLWYEKFRERNVEQSS